MALSDWVFIGSKPGILNEFKGFNVPDLCQTLKSNRVFIKSFLNLCSIALT